MKTTKHSWALCFTLILLAGRSCLAQEAVPAADETITTTPVTPATPPAAEPAPVPLATPPPEPAVPTAPEGAATTPAATSPTSDGADAATPPAANETITAQQPTSSLVQGSANLPSFYAVRACLPYNILIIPGIMETHSSHHPIMINRANSDQQINSAVTPASVV